MPSKNPTELVPTGKSAKHNDIATIMKDPQMKATLSSAIDTVLGYKSEIFKQQELIKQTRKDAVDELKMDPKLFNAYVAAAFNNDYQNRKQTLEEQVTLLEFIMGESGITYDSKDDDN